MHSFAKLLQRPVRVLEATEVELHVGATVAHQDSPMLLHAWIYHPSKTQNRKRMRKKRMTRIWLASHPTPTPAPLSVDFCYVVAMCGPWSLSNMTCTSSIKGG